MKKLLFEVTYIYLKVKLQFSVFIMNQVDCLILGASGKVGKYIVKQIQENKILSQFNNFILHYNSNKIETNSPRFHLLKCDFTFQEEIDRLIEKLGNFNIQLIINLASSFVESPITKGWDEAQKLIFSNSINQMYLFTKLINKLEKFFIIQVLDVSIKKPYSNKYFWYSISRLALFGFFKTLKKNKLANDKEIKFSLIFPKLIEENRDFEKISLLIDKLSKNHKEKIYII